MSRTNQILSVILVAQFALAAGVFWPKGAGDQGGLMFADYEDMKIVRLEIVDADDNNVVLSLTDDVWVLPEADEFVADGEKITPVLENLKALRTDRLVTMTVGSHARLEVADDKFKRRMQITWEDGAIHTLYLGSSGGAGATHFRQSDEEEVYITGKLTTWGTAARASSYIDTQYYSVPRDTVTMLRLENSNGTFEFVKDGEAWQYMNLADDEQFQESDLTTLLTQVTSIRMNTPLGMDEEPSYDLGNPQAVVTMQAASDEALHQYVFLVGAKMGDTYVASSTESPYLVTISPYVATSLINKTHEDFLQMPSEE